MSHPVAIKNSHEVYQEEGNLKTTSVCDGGHYFTDYYSVINTGHLLLLIHVFILLINVLLHDRRHLFKDATGDFLKGAQSGVLKNHGHSSRVFLKRGQCLPKNFCTLSSVRRDCEEKRAENDHYTLLRCTES